MKYPCSISGCPKPARTKGLCWMHYRRLQSTGDPNRTRRDIETEGGLTTPQVCQLTGVTFRQLDYWVRNGWVTPSKKDSYGSGSLRVFGPEQVGRIEALGALAPLWDPRAATKDQVIAALLESGSASYVSRTGRKVRIEVA